MSLLSLLALLLLVVCSAFAGSCNYKYHGHDSHEDELFHLPEPADGKLGWGQCADSELCSVGREQSPINIVTSEVVIRRDFGRLEFDSGSISNVVMTWTGHNQVFHSPSHPENEPSSFLHHELHEPYHLVQYHLHTPSEHTVDGVYYDAEIHMVHMNEARTKLAVIGMFVNQGNESNYSEFFETMIHEENHEHEHDETKFQDFDPTDFSKELSSSEYFYYKGSLTTPPCSEGVHWYLLNSPIYASPDQIRRLKMYQRHNSRPVQPVNDRHISFYPEEHVRDLCATDSSECLRNSSKTAEVPLVETVLTPHLDHIVDLTGLDLKAEL